MLNVDQTMDWKIDFYGQYFADISKKDPKRILSTTGGISENCQNIGDISVWNQ